MGDPVGYFDFESVVAGRKSGERQAAIQSDLFDVATDGAGGFRRRPDFFFVAKEAIGGGSTGFAKDFVEFEIVELHEEAEGFGVCEGVRKARADFEWAENKLASADLR